MNNTVRIITPAVVAVGFLSAAVPIAAHPYMGRGEFRGRGVENRAPADISCENIQKRANYANGKFEENIQRRQAKHNEMKDRLQTKIAGWKEEGKDTSEIEALVNELENKFGELDQRRETERGLVLEISNANCDEDGGNLTEQFKSYREETRSFVSGIREIMREQLRPAIDALSS